MPPDQVDDSSSSTDADNRHHDHQRQQPPMLSKPSLKILSLILRAIIMSILTSLFFLFLGIAAIFLAGHHLRRQPRFPSSSSGGMSKEDLHRLPRFRFDGGSQLESGSECAICLDGIRDGDFFRTLRTCSHAFHLDCIDTWLVTAPDCPICRTRVHARVDDQYEQLWAVRRT